MASRTVPPSDQWYSISQVAQLTVTSPSTVRRWIREGLIQATKFGHRRGSTPWRIRPRDLEDFIRDRGQPSRIVDLLEAPPIAPRPDLHIDPDEWMPIKEFKDRSLLRNDQILKINAANLLPVSNDQLGHIAYVQTRAAYRVIRELSSHRAKLQRESDVGVFTAPRPAPSSLPITSPFLGPAVEPTTADLERAYEESRHYHDFKDADTQDQS